MGQAAVKFLEDVVDHQGIIDEAQVFGSPVDGALERVDIIRSVIAVVLRGDAGVGR